VTALRREPVRPAALLLAALLLALTALWAIPAPAYACSCAAVSDNEHAANAAVIFTGTITDDRVDEGRQTRTLTFAVDRVFKGQATKTQVVATHASGAGCGLEISGPGPFVVFADQEQSRLTANLCGGTRPGSAPAAMGTGQAPVSNSAPDPGEGRWVPLVGLILALSGAAVLGLSFVRQQPR
jgi:hypothetical protein